MTICIAAICDGGHGLILASDREVGIGITSAEAVGKFLPLAPENPNATQWSIGLSGTATNATDAIGALRRMAATNTSFPTQEVRRLVEASYREARLAQAEARILGVRGLSLADFYKTGASHLSASVYAQIDAQVANFNFNADLIIAGFGDGDTGPAIFTATNPGVTTDHTVLGFWCVGSGATAAQVSLFTREYSWFMGAEQAAYYVFEAKRAAEKASGVGSVTDFHLVRKKGEPVTLGEPAKKLLEDIHKKLQPRPFLEKHRDQLRVLREFGMFSKS